MPRKSKGARLILDAERGTWTIRDGARAIRTGCVERDRAEAEKRLADYLGKKHKPKAGPNPLISDVLLVYAQEYIPHTKGAKDAGYHIASLSLFWGDKSLDGITAKSCREYAGKSSNATARRNLEVLRAAINYWNREYGPLGVVPVVALPPKSVPRDRWLTRTEAARLLRAARRHNHLRRFILIGLYTGTRSGPILQLRWDQVELGRGIMHRRPQGVAEDKRKKTPPVRLGRRILAHLRRWKRIDDGKAEYVCHYHGQLIRRGIQASWEAAVARSGLTGKVTPHCLRRTRATWLMQAGIDVWEAAGSLGMSVQMLTEVYGMHHPDFQRKASEV